VEDLHAPEPRSESAICGQLAELGVATVYEASGRKGLVDIPLQALIQGSRVAGPARTANCGQGDNRAVHEAVASLQPGEVLVLTMQDPAPVALVGELLITQAMKQGAAAVLVDAAVRDVEELRALGLPVWTRWLRARGATKTERGEVNVPVVVGGTRIEPGDLLVLDADGAVAVSERRVDEVLAASVARREKEEALRRRYSAGALSYDLYGMRQEDESAGSVGLEAVHE
jgi:4-hydroxy-4-methyl-2-oxoglutarate aldolase